MSVDLSFVADCAVSVSSDDPPRGWMLAVEALTKTGSESLEEFDSAMSKDGEENRAPAKRSGRRVEAMRKGLSTRSWWCLG